MRGLYVPGFWRETLAERFGATLGATIGVGTGATTPPLQLFDNQYQVRWVSPTFVISATPCAHAREERKAKDEKREGRKTSRDGRHQNGLYSTDNQPLDNLGFHQPPPSSCTVRSFAVSLHRHSALRPSNTWLSLTSTSAPQTYRRKRLLF
jgi:hypothetical protein